MAIEMLFGPFPTDMVAEHSAKMPPERAKDTFPLNAPFGEDREGSFGPLLIHILWRALSMAYI